MKIHNRSTWTALLPKLTVGTEAMDGLPNFRSEVKGISIVQPGTQALYVERDPRQFFQNFLKEDFNIEGYGDIRYNLGVSSNIEGVFCLRGLCNKGYASSSENINSEYVSVLALVGDDEKPTDLLLQNLVDALVLVLGRWPNASNRIYKTTDALKEVVEKYVSPPVGNFSSQFNYDMSQVYSTEASIHVFDLIENLAYWGYYKGRNDGVYGAITTHAIRELQADLRLSGLYKGNIDGQYSNSTREAFGLYLATLSQKAA